MSPSIRRPLVVRRTLRALRAVAIALRAVAIALITPILEKNPAKTASFTTAAVPLVVSMSRVIVLCFAWRMQWQIERTGVAGWPEATLCMVIVLTLPLLSALERVKAADTIAIVTTLLGRVGVGTPRTVATLATLPGESPNKYDDHREDGPARRTGRAA